MGDDDAGGGGGAAAAPAPAPAAAENHKGVMLSERPTYPDSKPSATGGRQPFFPGGNTKVYEPWGANPVEKILQPSFPLKKTVFDAHLRLLRRWQRAARNKAVAREADVREEIRSYHRVGEQAAVIRHAILSGAPDLAETWAPAARAASIRQLQAANDRTALVEPPPTIDRSAVDDEMAALVDRACAEVAPASAAAAAAAKQPVASTSGAEHSSSRSAPAGKAAVPPLATAAAAAAAGTKKAAGPAKPAWALTAGEAEAKAEAEEAELLQFAENLDFEEYLDGIEDAALQAALRAMVPSDGLLSASGATGGGGAGDTGASALSGSALMADKSETWKAQFVQAVNHLAAKGWLKTPRGPGSVAGGDGASVAGESTLGGEASARGAASGTQAAVKGILAANPSLKVMHSERSLKALVESTAPKPIDAGGA